MRYFLIVPAALLVAVVGITTEAGAFTFEPPLNGNAGETPRLIEPDQRDERATDPSGSSSLFLGSRRGRSDRYDRYGGDPTFEPRPLPRGARIGAGDQGFENYRRFQQR